MRWRVVGEGREWVRERHGVAGVEEQYGDVERFRAGVTGAEDRRSAELKETHERLLLFALLCAVDGEGEGERGGDFHACRERQSKRYLVKRSDHILRHLRDGECVCVLPVLPLRYPRARHGVSFQPSC